MSTHDSIAAEPCGGVEVLSTAEENALGLLREIVAAIRLGASPVEFGALEGALASAGAFRLALAIGGNGGIFALGAVRFSLVCDARPGGAVVVDFDPQPV
jgi:hypothetical protein